MPSPMQRSGGRPANKGALLGIKHQGDSYERPAVRMFAVATRLYLFDGLAKKTFHHGVLFSELEFEDPMTHSDIHFKIATAQCGMALSLRFNSSAPEKNLQQCAAAGFACDRIILVVDCIEDPVEVIYGFLNTPIF